MRIAVGSDHAGFELKQNILEFLRKLGQEALDLGAHNTNPVDYPDYAEAVGLVLREGKAECDGNMADRGSRRMDVCELWKHLQNPLQAIPRQ